MEITVEDIKQWQDSDVTREFFSYVDRFREDKDREVHRLLEDNEKEQAALSNASMCSFEDVFDIPEHMIKDIQERENK